MRCINDDVALSRPLEGPLSAHNPSLRVQATRGSSADSGKHACQRLDCGAAAFHGLSNKRERRGKKLASSQCDGIPALLPCRFRFHANLLAQVRGRRRLDANEHFQLAFQLFDVPGERDLRLFGRLIEDRKRQVPFRRERGKHPFLDRAFRDQKIDVHVPPLAHAMRAGDSRSLGLLGDQYHCDQWQVLPARSHKDYPEDTYGLARRASRDGSLFMPSPQSAEK